MNLLQLLTPERLHQMPGPLPADRSAFEADFDRIIFSQPFRSLQNKTQVVPLPDHDFVHTRLTHSLEVSSVGRSLGRMVGQWLCEQYPELTQEGCSAFDISAIVAAACLAHDLGNPPFGHAGEAAISNFFQHIDLSDFSEAEAKDLTSFEGNAQGFRLLVTRKDLRPTLAVLGAFTKYPCASAFEGKNTALKSQKKYGFFQSEKLDFQNLAMRLGLSTSGLAHVRHPLSFLVEAADDLCYLLIDLEDAVGMRKIDIGLFESCMAEVLGASMPAGPNYAARSPQERAGLLRAMGINLLVQQSVGAFQNHHQAILSGTLEQPLTALIPAAKALDDISNFSVRHIYQSEEVLFLQATGYEILPELIHMFYEAQEAVFQHGKKAAPKFKNLCGLLPYEVGKWEADLSPYLRIRVLLDFIAGLSDRKAMDVYAKIKGIRIR
jgi:dGTPase